MANKWFKKSLMVGLAGLALAGCASGGNQSTENYLVDSDVVALASHCQVLEQQLVILPKGFVIQ